MRILIFHGYLLRGTGSNIYNANLVRALAAPRPRGRAALPGPRLGRRPRACTVHMPDIGRVLPVYVADRYEGFDAKPYPRADRRGARALHRGERGGRARRRPTARRGAGQPPRHGAGDPRARLEAGALRREDPRQRARVHGAPAPASASCPTRSRASAARAGVLVGSRHTAESRCGGAGRRAGAPRAHAPRPAGRGRPHVPPAASRTWSGSRLARPAARPWGGEAGAADALARARPAPGPDRELRGQADRLEGRGPAAGRLAAGGGARAGRAARDRRLRHLPRGARALRGGAARARDLEALREIAARGRELEGGPRGRAEAT